MELAKAFGRELSPNAVLLFYGDLGAGKTTFIKGLVAGITDSARQEVNSPTFTYLNIYKGPKMHVYHFDLYRLRDVDEFLSMGFDEMFDAGGVCCVEWAERISKIPLKEVFHVECSHIDEGTRKITIRKDQ